MSKYRVRLLRDATLYLDVVVEAEDETEAEEQAQMAAFGPARWELSDDTGAPYVAGGSTEEVDDE
jgi:hypothetical protein